MKLMMGADHCHQEGYSTGTHVSTTFKQQIVCAPLPVIGNDAFMEQNIYAMNLKYNVIPSEIYF